MFAAFSTEPHMQYTVWSGERQIGITDLGFRYRRGGSRTGWFIPTAESEPLMPDIVVPLIGTYVQIRRTGRCEPLDGNEIAQLAAYESACKRAATADLRVRREDGSLVPTESVAIQDVEALLACLHDTEGDLEDACDFDGDFDFEFDDDPSEAWKRDPEEWIPDDDALPRYQIWVLLADDTAVP